jgi:four helix bundle protein
MTNVGERQVMDTPPESVGEESGRKFNLEERTAKFGEAIIRFLKLVPKNSITVPLVKQLVRSATSIGANYCEADDAQTNKEFKYRISICRKEARETMYWLRMIASAAEQHREVARTHWQEAKELNLIFSSILRKSKS